MSVLESRGCQLGPPRALSSLIRFPLLSRRVLEEFQYSSVYSVNDEEPPTTHSLIFNLQHHVSGEGEGREAEER